MPPSGLYDKKGLVYVDGSAVSNNCCCLLAHLELLTRIHYSCTMKATLTSRGQVTIPTAIRRRLGLKPGQVLEFDENTPYLMAVPTFDKQAMRALVGCTSGKLAMTTDEWLDETRGPAVEEQ